MVGTTGFEPATSRTPSVRATRLRHVPTGCSVFPQKTIAGISGLFGDQGRANLHHVPTASKNSVSLAFEEGQGGQKLFAQIEQTFALRTRKFVIAFANWWRGN